MSELEQLKLSAALSIAKCHRELTPYSQTACCPAADRITWRQWWERKYKDDYAKFVRDNFQHFKKITEPKT